MQQSSWNTGRLILCQYGMQHRWASTSSLSVSPQSTPGPPLCEAVIFHFGGAWPFHAGPRRIHVRSSAHRSPHKLFGLCFAVPSKSSTLLSCSPSPSIKYGCFWQSTQQTRTTGAEEERSCRQSHLVRRRLRPSDCEACRSGEARQALR